MGGFFVFLVLVLMQKIDGAVVGSAETELLETYIVHLELPPNQPTLRGANMDDLDRWYDSFLPATAPLSSSEEVPRMLYSYHNVFPGFAARLSARQVKEMEKIPGFVSARPQRYSDLETTHSPNFLGLNQNMGFWKETNYGRGVIIGVLDSGIIPDHPSFGDEGMPPPPAKWRGSCDFNTTTTVCNNKLIGARSFTIGNGGSPLDVTGHGTHCASTAAGNFVAGANVFGNANGTAAGVAPLAHIAVYKVCHARCPESDILAGMDAAIDDGVDILSLSIGGTAAAFDIEAEAIGGFTAIERGIFVSAAAGNRGPTPGTIKNGAPWVLTVGASTTDRRIRATALLGNGDQFDGESTFQPASFNSSAFLPLVYPGLNSSDPNATFCFPASLRSFDLVGKIVLCEFGGGIGRVGKGMAVRAAGAAAMILVNRQAQGFGIHSDSHVLPATHLSYDAGIQIKSYLTLSTTEPVATILFKGTIIGDDSAPTVADFSARGPNTASPGILKPDIIGPGVNILAAWHNSVENNTGTKANFNIISGTSMSCPHLSGVAALLKSAHPDWSPAAIKSAIMTTADQVNLAGNPIQDQTLQPADVYATGAGHVNILKAMNPGLIYDLVPDDYIPYLCGLGYTDQQVASVIDRVITCSTISSIPEAQLNYPSFSVRIGNNSLRYTRMVTNVGDANSVYSVIVGQPAGAELTVVPTTLHFSQVNEKLSYEVTFTRLATAQSGHASQGFLTWNSTTHTVRSPIMVTFM